MDIPTSSAADPASIRQGEWRARGEALSDVAGLRFSVERAGHPASFADVLAGWRDDDDCCALFDRLIADAPYAALRWDFGDSGRTALARLAKSSNPTIAQFAALAEKQPDRSYRYGRDTTFRTEAQIDVRVQPADPALRRLVIEYLQTHRSVCEKFCVALDLGPSRNGKRDVALVEEYGYERVSLPAGRSVPPASEPRQASRPFGRASQVEIRPVEQRYVFVDGQRVGEPLD